MIEGRSRGDHEEFARPDDLIQGPGVVLPQRERNVRIVCGYRGNLLRDKILFGDLYILRRQRSATEQCQKAVTHELVANLTATLWGFVNFCK